MAAIRDMCREVLRVVNVQDNALYRTEVFQTHTPIPQARAVLWKDHLQSVLEAKRAGRELPPPPEPLDSSDPRTFSRCHACRDTGWIEGQCKGGVERSCGRTSHRQFVSEGNKSFFVGACGYPHPYASRCHCRR